MAGKQENKQSTPKIAKTSEEQDQIRRAKKQKERHGRTQQPATRSLSIPEEAEKLHMTRVIDVIMSVTVNQRRGELLTALVMAYSELTKEQVRESGKSRVALTFDKVTEVVGADTLATLKKDWAQAKKIFAETVHNHSYWSCANEVAAERRASHERFKAASAQLTTSIGAFVGTRLENLMQERELVDA